MKNIARFAAPALLAATLTVGIGAGSATAEDGEPCAEQQAKVTKAEDALDRVTAVFEKRQAKVKKAKNQLAHADKRGEKAKAAKGLAIAKEKQARAKKAKKAQKMRLEKAQRRLDGCLAAQPPVDPPVVEA